MNEEEKLKYIKDNYPAKGLIEISQFLGWSSADPVRDRLRKLGIPLRGRGASTTERQTSLTSEQHEILEGWLLSDGSLECSGTLVTPLFRLSLTQIAAIEYTQSHLPFSFAKIWERKTTEIQWGTKDAFVLRSHCDRSLVPYWERWYSGGSKRIPSDFIATPTTMRFAIYGDGTAQSNSPHSLGTYSLTLCLEAFSQLDKERLVSQLNALGFDFKINKRGRPFICGKDNLNKFLDWLGTPELECYAYMFTRPAYGPKEQTRVIEFVKKMSKPNVSNGFIASELNKLGLRTYRGTKFSSWIVQKMRTDNNFPLSEMKSRAIVEL